MLRSFSEEKAREFYVDFMGFKVNWEHPVEPDTPLYMELERPRATHAGDPISREQPRNTFMLPA